MPKGGKKKGGKKKRRGKNVGGAKRELLFAEDGQNYGQVTKVLGNCRLDILCIDGKKRLGHVRGKMRKRVWINVDNIILYGVREFEDGKVDIIHKYDDDEARTLQAYEEIPKSFAVGGQTAEEKNEDRGGIIFKNYDSDGNSCNDSVNPDSDNDSSDDSEDTEDLLANL